MVRSAGPGPEQIFHQVQTHFSLEEESRAPDHKSAVTGGTLLPGIPRRTHMLLLEKVPQEQNVHGTVGYSNIETDDTEQLFLPEHQLQLGPFQLITVLRRLLPEPF